MKVTKEQLQKENAVLKDQLEMWKENDLSRRTVLSELLGSYELFSEYGYSNRNSKKVDVRDWLGISFLIGELKSDADYSCVLEGKEIFRRENEGLRQKIKELENPEVKPPHHV